MKSSYKGTIYGFLMPATESISALQTGTFRGTVRHLRFQVWGLGFGGLVCKP